MRHVAEVLGTVASDFEVIVSNDGSRDNTAAVLARLQLSEPDLHLLVVTHERNRGYGAAHLRDQFVKGGGVQFGVPSRSPVATRRPRKIGYQKK